MIPTQRRNRRRLPPAATNLMLTLTSLSSMSCPAPFLPSSHPLASASAFSLESASATHRAAVAATTRALRPPPRTICRAKLRKVASTFDLDEILSNEREFDDDPLPIEGRETPKSRSKGSRGRRGKNANNATKERKLRMKEELKRQRMERRRSKKRTKERSSGATEGAASRAETSDENDFDRNSDVHYDTLIRSMDFLAYEVPTSLDGKRIDAGLAELLNDDDGSSNSVAISRSQCGTLLSHDCVFVVPPEGATEFRSAWSAARRSGTEPEEGSGTAVPHGVIERHGSPVRRKSHPLESSSILVYPSRQSLLSASNAWAFMPPTEIIAQKIPLKILYEDEHMIVLNKQAGMVVHPAAGNWDGTMVNALAYYLINESPFGAGEFFAGDAKGKECSPHSNAKTPSSDADVNQNDAVTNSISTLRPGIVHRLDKGTTGVLVVAKTSSALATLSEAFAERRVKKQYLAVAIGNPGEDQWINKPIGRHPVHRQKMRVVPDPSSSMTARGQGRVTGPNSAAMTKQGRAALSHIHTVHYDGKLSVVRVKIATGRTHQIRVHLQDHGTPIYGDDVYGLSDWNKALSSRRGIARPLLHAHRLEIEHPATGENMVFEAEVEDDMMGVIKAIWPAGGKIEL